MQPSIIEVEQGVDSDSQVVDILPVTVRRLDGTSVPCNMAADGTVADLLEAYWRANPDGCLVDKVHHAQLEEVLLTEEGQMMTLHSKLADYGLGVDSTVTLLLKMRLQGSYCCWLAFECDHPHHIDWVKFSLIIQEDKVSITINDTPGTISSMTDGSNGEVQLAIELSKPVVLKSERPWDRRELQATTCEMSLTSANYKRLTNPGYFPIQGKLTGQTASRFRTTKSAAFKGRYAPA